jgi:L-seryl-tRNA(Ser) seleniumtransferase
LNDLRDLPSITTVLDTMRGAAMVRAFGHAAATEAIRGTVSDARAAARAGAFVPDAEAIAITATLR